MSFFDFHVPLKYRVQTIAVAAPQPTLVDTAMARKPIVGAKISVTASRVMIDAAEWTAAMIVSPAPSSTPAKQYIIAMSG